MQRGSGVRMLRAQRFLFDRQRALKEWLGFPVAPLVLVEYCQVVERGRGVRMLRAQRFLTDCQRLLKEWLGFPIASLVLVESCQVIERGTGVRMLRAQRFLIDCQRLLEERLGLWVLSMILEIGGCPIEQPCCLRNVELMLVDEGGTGQSVGQQVLDRQPAFVWK